MKKLKQKLKLVSVALILFTSCSDVDEKPNLKKTETSAFNISDFEISKVSYRYDGEDVEMLEFSSLSQFDSVYDYLKTETEVYETNIIDNHFISSGDTVIVYDEIGLDEDVILKNFEQSLSFTNSMRKAYRQAEDIWMNSSVLDTINTPLKMFPFDDEMLSLVNSKGEVKIGDTIYKFTNDGYLAITDGNFTTLCDFNIGNTEVVNAGNVISNINEYKKSESCGTYGKKTAYVPYFKDPNANFPLFLFGTTLKFEFNGPVLNLLVNQYYGFAKCTFTVKSYILLKKKGTNINRLYKCAIAGTNVVCYTAFRSYNCSSIINETDSQTKMKHSISAKCSHAEINSSFVNSYIKYQKSGNTHGGLHLSFLDYETNL